MTADEGEPEEDAETGCVEEAEIGVVGIVVVEEAEEEADGQDGCPGADLAEKCLEGEAMKEQFFSSGTGQNQHGKKEGGAPICSGTGTGFEVGPVKCQRNGNNQES